MITKENKRMKYIFLILLTFFLISSSSILAAPPFSTSTATTVGFDIRPLALDTIKENINYTFHWHVFNQTNGFPVIDNIGCYVHLYDSTGEHTAQGFVNTVDHDTDSSLDYEYIINQKNFTLGQHVLNVQCNSTSIGGAAVNTFMVTSSGNVDDTGLLNSVPLIYLLLFLSYGLLIFAFVKEDSTIMTISSMLLILTGIFVWLYGINNTINWLTQGFAIVTVAIGSYILLRNAIDGVAELNQ